MITVQDAFRVPCSGTAVNNLDFKMLKTDDGTRPSQGPLCMNSAAQTEVIW